MEHAVLETASDRYVLEEYLAEGGMGAIYLGKKLGPGSVETAVVLKQLLPEFTSEPQFIGLFLREARITASLDHPNIVRTLDLVHAGKDYFIVMEYVRGADLRTLLRRARRRGRQLSLSAAIYVGLGIADALAYAHARVQPDGSPLGLIHRDISPSNILVSGAGDVKLTDFGIAKAATHRSVFYKVKGKVGYMSPEQARGETLDARSDVFSLGVCLFEALVGERLFIGDFRSTPSMIFSQPVPRISDRRRDAPTDLDGVVFRALALDRAQRFSSAGELAEALRKVGRRHHLLFSATEMADHLAEACGANIDAWLRAEAGEERAGATDQFDARDGEPNAASEDEPDEDEPDEPGEDDLEAAEDERPPHRLDEGTQLTSILNLRTRRGAAEARWEIEPTTDYEDGLSARSRMRDDRPADERERTGVSGPPRTGWPESALSPLPPLTDEPTAHLVLPPLAEAAREETRSSDPAPRSAPRDQVARPGNEPARPKGKAARTEGEPARPEREATRPDSESARPRSDAAQSKAEAAQSEVDAAQSESELPRFQSEMTRFGTQPIRPDRAGDEAIRPGNEAARSGNGAIRSGIEVDRTGNSASRAENDADRTGNWASRTGNEVEHPGGEAIRSGSARTRSDGIERARAGRVARPENTAAHPGIEATGGENGANWPENDASRSGNVATRTGNEAKRPGNGPTRTGNEETRTGNKAARSDSEANRLENEADRTGNRASRTENRAARTGKEGSRNGNERARSENERAHARDEAARLHHDEDRPELGPKSVAGSQTRPTARARSPRSQRDDPTLPRLRPPPVHTEIVRRPRGGVPRRVLIALAVGVILATGVLLGALLSDPGAEPDTPLTFPTK